ncbi:MAG: hypothetical protein CVU79_09075 [Elusimicrobia bacterium HGW-Elusimicrobia-3]|jgi:hypothetical protein|nr:MAG: hypothetical protein CVU79_09075 [Elusimicrobia bacterium HGW-Elusimicrobia-3]
MKRQKPYDQFIELQKGATLTAASSDRTQRITVIADKVTVGGMTGRAEISGLATGRHGGSTEGCLSLWFSNFRYMRPDGVTEHVAGWNITLHPAPGQTAMQTGAAFAAEIDAGTRPYKAAAYGSDHTAELLIVCGSLRELNRKFPG